MSLAIAIETSTRVGSVAVSFRGERRRADLGESRAHASDLMPAIDRLVRELGATPGDMSAVLVGTGPGSYTGLRVGIATALGLARAAGAGARGVPSGEILAFGALDPGQSAFHLIDARSGGFYLARFERTAEEVVVLETPCVVGRDELEARLAASIPILADPETIAASGLSPETAERARVDVRPDANALLALGLARDCDAFGAEPLGKILPLYLRPFGVRHGS